MKRSSHRVLEAMMLPARLESGDGKGVRFRFQSDFIERFFVHSSQSGQYRSETTLVSDYHLEWENKLLIRSQ